MDAVILAAGRGTRLGEITKTIPKSLVEVGNKSILEYILSSLPSSTDEVFIVIGHLGEKIKKRFGSKFKNLKIKYVQLKNLDGTAKAVWAVKPFLKNNKFLVLNGDDLYNKSELENMTKNGWTFGLAKTIPPRPHYLNIEVNKNKNIIGARYPTKKETKEGILMATGVYVLDKEIFKYKPVKISGGEYGLPQTILKLAPERPIKAIIMKKWIQINTPEDIIKANKYLNKK